MLRVEGSPALFGRPDEYLVGPPIIVRWSGYFVPQTQAHCLLEPSACTISTARRLTYGIERTGAAKNRFLAEFLGMDQASIEQTNHSFP